MTSTRSPSIITARTQTILLAGALSLWSMPVFAQARPERLSDKAVKTLIEQVDEGRDKFEGNLDGQFKASTLRGPGGGETKVAGAPRTIKTTPRSSRIDSPPTTPPAPRSLPSSNSPRPSTRSCRARRVP